MGACAKRRIFAITIALLIGFAVPGGAWLLRNYDKTGVPLISTIDGHNMSSTEQSARSSRKARPDNAPSMKFSFDSHRICTLVKTRPGSVAPNRRSGSRFSLNILLEPSRTGREGRRGLLLGPARSETATLLTGDAVANPTWLRLLVFLDQLITGAIVIGAATGVAGLLISEYGTRPYGSWSRQPRIS